MIAQVLGLSDYNGIVPFAVNPGAQPADSSLVERLCFVHTIKVEGIDWLLLAVLINAEITLLEPLHNLAGLGVARHHVRQHQVAIHLQHKAALRYPRVLLARCAASVLRRRLLRPRHNQNQRRNPSSAILCPTPHKMPTGNNSLTC